MNGLIISLPIWGEAYVELWARCALPAMLTPGNLPWLAAGSPVTVLIHTTEEDAQRLAPHVSDLAQHCTVVTDVLGTTASDLMERLHPGYRHAGTCFKECQNLALARAWEQNAGIIFWSADQVWGDGNGQEIWATVQHGHRALVHVGYRTANEEMVTKLSAPYLRNPSDLARMFLYTNRVGSLPPSIEEPGWVVNPSNLRWSTGDGRGMLVRPMHANCTFAWPTRGPAKMLNGTDHDLGAVAFGNDPSLARIITDTSDFMIMGVEPLGNSGQGSAGGLAVPTKPQVHPLYRPALAALYLMTWSDPWRLHFLRQRFWCHDGTLKPTEAARLRAEAASDREIEAIFRELARIKTGGATQQEVLEQRRMILGDWSE